MKVLINIYFLALIKSQSIQIYKDVVEIGDNINLQCTYPEDFSSSPIKYIWFFNSKKNFFECF